MNRRNALPDAEAALAALAERMQGAIAIDAGLVGIYSGGAWLAQRLAEMLPGNHPLGYIDVSFYRDDYSKKGLHANVATTQLPFEVGGSRIVLIDDVLYTGRSVRAAINELFDYGRPDSIELAVLIDRGGRELPFEPTYVGARVSVASAIMNLPERRPLVRSRPSTPSNRAARTSRAPGTSTRRRTQSRPRARPRRARACPSTA